MASSRAVGRTRDENARPSIAGHDVELQYVVPRGTARSIGDANARGPYAATSIVLDGVVADREGVEAADDVETVPFRVPEQVAADETLWCFGSRERLEFASDSQRADKFVAVDEDSPVVSGDDDIVRRGGESNEIVRDGGIPPAVEHKIHRRAKPRAGVAKRGVRADQVPYYGGVVGPLEQDVRPAKAPDVQTRESRVVAGYKRQAVAREAISEDLDDR